MASSSMLLPKLLYICLYALLGSAIPYLSLYYDEALGLNSKQIGSLLAIAPFAQSVACPLWTIIADRRPAWHGPLMAGLTLVGGLSVMSLMALPSLLQSGNATETDILWITVALALVFAFFGQPVSALVDSAVLKMLGDQKILYGSQRLWGSISNGVNILIVGLLITIIGIQVAFYVFAVGVSLFILLALFTRVDRAVGQDNTHTTLVGRGDENGNDETRPLLKSPPCGMRNHYAILPIPASQPEPKSSSLLSTSFFSAVSNVITNTSTHIDTSCPTSQSHLHPPTRQCFPKASSGDADSMQRRASVSSHDTIYLDEEDHRHLDLLCSTTTSMAARDAQREASEVLSHLEHTPSLGLVLSKIPTIDTSLASLAALGQHETPAPGASTLRKRRVWTFLVMTLLAGISYSMVAQFLFLFLRNDLGLEPSLIGWTGPIGGVAEVSTFYMSKVFDKYSITSLVVFSHAVLIGRNMVYTWLIPDQALSTIVALGLQLVNGLAYAMIWSTAVGEVDTFFPPDQRAMAQGILAALFSGLGFGLGCVLGGTVYGRYGPDALFDTSAAIAFLSLGVFLLGRCSRTPS